MAKALANQGANIVALARRRDKIEAVAKQIKEQFEVDTLAVKCDITDTEAVNAAVKKVLDRFGKIDILIYNAGTGAVAPAEDITDDQFSNEVNVDLFGTFKVAREVAKQAMIPQKYGRIINIAFLVKVSITDLNIRKGPGTDYARTQFIPVGVYTIVKVKSGKGSTAGWGRLKSGAGWISLDYTVRI